MSKRRVYAVALALTTGLLLVGCGDKFTRIAVPPVAVDDDFDVVGNVRLVRAAVDGLVLPNDFDLNLDPLTVVAFDAVGTMGGDVSVNPDGSFTYEPPLGFEGVDSFEYTIEDPFGFQDSATVTLNVADVVWFLDANAAPGGDGRFTDPFDTLAAFNAEQGGGADNQPEPGDTIFLYGAGGASYAGEIVLLDDQDLIGQGVSLVVGGTTVVTASTNAEILGGVGATVTLAMDNAIRGLDVMNTAGDGILGGSVGTLVVDTTSVSASGGVAFQVSVGGTLAVALDDVTSDLSPLNGIGLVSCSGTFLVNGTATVLGAGGHGIYVGTSTCSVSIADLQIVDVDQHGILLQNNSGAFVCDGGLIDNPDDIGILCEGLTGPVTIRDLTVQETGDAAVPLQEAHGILCDDCTGNLTFDACTFEDMNEHGPGSGDDNNGIQVEMEGGGTLASLQITDCAFIGMEVAALGTTMDHGVRVLLDNDSVITDLDITGCTCIDLGRGFAEVLVDPDDDGDFCEITDLNVSDNPDLEAQGDVIEVRVNGASALPMFHIDRNVIADGGTGLSSGYGILVAVGQFGLGIVSTSSVRGTMNGNDIDDVGDGAFDRGIELLMQDASTAVIEIDENTVDGQSDEAVSIRCFDDSGADVTITNNDLGLVSGNDAAGAGTDGVHARTTQNAALCLDLAGNDVGAQNYVPERASATSGFLLFNIPGTPPFTAGEVDTFLEGQNTGTSAAVGVDFGVCAAIQTP